MKHWFINEWSIGDFEAYIDCHEVYNWVKYKKLTPEMIPINKIGCVDLNRIDETDPRYILANINLPGLLVEGMENPYNKPYRMIDGRHRLLKSVNLKKASILTYVLTREHALKFIKQYS